MKEAQDIRQVHLWMSLSAIHILFAPYPIALPIKKSEYIQTK